MNCYQFLFILFISCLLTYTSQAQQADSSFLNTAVHDIIPPMPPPLKPIIEQAYKKANCYPRFPGCETIKGTVKEKSTCANEKMFQFIYKHLVYSDKAKLAGIEGDCPIEFVVEKNGSVTRIKALDEIGEGCCAEVVRVIGLMNEKGLQWTLCPLRGRTVPILFNISVPFNLEE